LQHDSRLSLFRKKIIKKSDELKSSAKFEQLPDKLNDILAARWASSHSSPSDARRTV